MVESGMWLMENLGDPGSPMMKSVLGNHLLVVISSWPEAALSQSWPPQRGWEHSPRDRGRTRGWELGLQLSEVPPPLPTQEIRMLKKIVSVQRVSAQSGAERPGGLGVPPRRKPEGGGRQRPCEGLLEPRPCRAGAEAIPRRSSTGCHRPQRGPEQAVPRVTCILPPDWRWPQTLRASGRDKGMGVSGGAADHAEGEPRARQGRAQVHPWTVTRPSSLHYSDPCTQEPRRPAGSQSLGTP